MSTPASRSFAGIARPDALRCERVRKAKSPPRLGEIDLVTPERDLRRADRRLRDTLDERLAPLHRVAVVGERLIPLDLRELRRMLVRDALVPKVLRELVDLLETADDQPLQIELVRDPQVETLVEQARARHERLGEAAAVARLQDRRLDLDETLAVEVGADLRHHPRPQHRVAPRLLVHQQVEVAAPVARLDVGQAVKRVGQRRPDPRQQLERVHHERRLAPARPRRRAGHADDVTEVNVDLAGALDWAEELDAAGAVDEIEEDELSQVTARQHAAREAPRRPGRLVIRERLRLRADGDDLVAVGEAFRRGHGARV